MEKGKNFKCTCCKRPFKRDYSPAYNLMMYGMGIVCIDCAERIEKIYRQKNSGFALPKITSDYMKRFNINEPLEATMEYKKDEFEPFSLCIKSGEWASNIRFKTLDNVKKLRDILTKFIDECEV